MKFCDLSKEIERAHGEDFLAGIAEELWSLVETAELVEINRTLRLMTIRAKLH
jgi:hypothetical protein